jgi:hypothetical protein
MISVSFLPEVSEGVAECVFAHIDAWALYLLGALVNCSDVAEQRLPAVGIRYAKLILPRRHAVERSEKGRDLHSSNGKSGARRLRPSFKHQVIFSQFTISSWSAELSATCQTRTYGDFLIDT